jgi:hypothetical protein
VGGQVLPTVRRGLVGAAGELNTMGKNALTAVSNLEKTGTLGKVFDGVRSSLGNLNRVPGQLVTASPSCRWPHSPRSTGSPGRGRRHGPGHGKLARVSKDGKLEEAINTALDVAMKFGTCPR